MAQLRAVVTGASSGIGAAVVQALTGQGWQVIAAARRQDRLAELAERTGCLPIRCDVTDPDDIAALRDYVESTGSGLHTLVNNAGFALGFDTVEDGDVDDWRAMFETNTIGTMRVTQALLPALRESGRGDLVFMTSTAASGTYPGGGGYVAAKHAMGALARTMRLELVGEPLRVIEIAPGMVHTEEFSVHRARGDQARADAVYAGVAEPLTADDVAECVRWAVSLPHHINIDTLIVRPRAQAAQHLVARAAAAPLTPGVG